MRWLIVVVGWLLLAPAVQAQDAAQKLFETMEQKLAKAKALKLGFEIDALDHGEQIKLKGMMILATGNRVKLTFEGQAGKKSLKGTMVSDGKTFVLDGEEDGKPDKKNKPVHDKLHETLSGWLIRAGLFLAVESTESTKPKDAGQLKLTDFKMAGKEKIGGREAQAIEYQLVPPDGKDSAKCKLWLDAQTNLPLKRVLEAGGGKFRVVEAYSQWELDPKLPEGSFTLPK